MKRLLACLLVFMLLCGMNTAAAFTDEQAFDMVHMYLTEVFGYTLEEADAFEMLVDRNVIIFFKNSQWRYSAVYDEANDKLTDVDTPFDGEEGFTAYPGENSVRTVLRLAREQGWFVRWDGASRAAFQNAMQANGVQPSARLAEALDTMEASEALHEFFVSCYGEYTDWSFELRNWYQQEMEEYAFTYTGAPAMAEGIAVWTQKQSSGQDVEMTRFIGEVPDELASVFAHPKLEGWTCLSGAMMKGVKNQYGFGLAAFEKDGQRLLAAYRSGGGAGEWQLSPVSMQALYTDKPVVISPAEGLRTVEIIYTDGTETERFEVTLVSTNDDVTDAVIKQYTRMNAADGSGFRLDFDNGVNATVYENHVKVKKQQLPSSITQTISMVDIHTFPTTLEAAEKARQGLIPEGYLMVNGVHLRQKTSSRSKNLGDYHAGVLAEYLGTEAGDPAPWYHVRIGQAEGYMSSSYVTYAYPGGAIYLSGNTLSVAEAQKEIALKKSPSALSGTVQKIEEGTLMHVLAECDGGWLHVSIPQGTFDVMMDPEGTDGYIRKKDVLTAATPLALEWGN